MAVKTPKMLHKISVLNSAVKRLIASKIKVFVYIIYVCHTSGLSVCVFLPMCSRDPVSPSRLINHLVHVCPVNYPCLVQYLKCCLFLDSFVRCHPCYVLHVCSCLPCVTPDFGLLKTVIRISPSSPRSFTPHSSIADNVCVRCIFIMYI